MQITPTATPTPVLWATPTPRPIVEVTIPFSLPTTMGETIAEEAVQGYHMVNQSGILDSLSSVAMLIIVFIGISSIFARLKDL